MPKSSIAEPKVKPPKPGKHFPLFHHQTGRWCKNYKGTFYYFGKVADDPGGKAALALWNKQKDDIQEGRLKPSTIKTPTKAASVADVINSFLRYKLQALNDGDVAQRTFDRYRKTGEFLADAIGRNTIAKTLRPDDFLTLRAKMSKRWGAVALGNEIQIVRSIFKHGVDVGLLKANTKFGPGFMKPKAKTLRAVKQAAGPKMFSTADLLKALAAADTNMHAMLLLAINGALGNTDIALLPLSAFDLKGGWLDYPRHKTNIPRRIPLWPETVTAVKKCTAERREPKDPNDGPLLFISPHGLNYVGKHKGYRVHAALMRLMAVVKIEGRSFYDLRRTFQTVGEGARDLSAVQSIMGHAPPMNDMSADYRQSVDDERLKAVTDHVRAWLWPAGSHKRTTKRMGKQSP